VVQSKGLLSLHAAVLLFGLAGLFGKLVSASAQVIVLGRTGFATLTLLIVSRYIGQSLRTESRRDQIFLALSGVLLAAHWQTFFLSIQLSTVAIGLLTFSSFPLFVTLLEPIFFRERPRSRDFGFAILVTLGLVLVVPSIDPVQPFARGAFWGLVSGLSFALLSLLNRGYVRRYPARAVAFHQNLFAALVLLPFTIGSAALPSARDLILLVFLGVVCTALAHALFISALRSVKTALAGVTAALEPVYGILLAIPLLGEVPPPRVIFGGLLILGATILATLFRAREPSEPES